MLEARAFEPEFLRKLDRLVLGIKRARTVRAGQRTLGRVQGLGIEPENFRDYAEGDDLRAAGIAVVYGDASVCDPGH